MGHTFAHKALFNADISEWEVSRVKEMTSMFEGATSFNGDISKWDVSSVTSMYGMFSSTSFNGDLSKWDVSRVTDMTAMFQRAESFNGDISEWDVSSVSSMDLMFFHAKSFEQQLCGAAWRNSKARKSGMFTGSYGSISRSVHTTTQCFSSKAELEDAVDACLELTP